MRQIYLHARNQNVTGMNDLDKPYWVVNGYDITLELLKDEDELKQKIKQQYPTIIYRGSWSDRDKERALDLGRWWCEDHGYEHVDNLQKRYLPPALRFLMDTKVIDFQKAEAEEPGTPKGIGEYEASIIYRRLMYVFAEHIADRPGTEVFEREYVEGFEKFIGVLLDRKLSVVNASAMQYIRAKRVPVKELMQVAYFTKEGNGGRFKEICKEHDLNSEALSLFFWELHGDVERLILKELKVKNPWRENSLLEKLYIGGVLAALKGEPLPDLASRAEGWHWCQAAMERHTDALLKSYA